MYVLILETRSHRIKKLADTIIKSRLKEPTLPTSTHTALRQELADCTTKCSRIDRQALRPLGLAPTVTSVCLARSLKPVRAGAGLGGVGRGGEYKSQLTGWDRWVGGHSM